MALYACYELHYQGLPGVDDRWEWEPSLLAQRAELELVFEQRLCEDLPPVPTASEEVVPILWAMTEGHGRSLSGWAEQHGTLAHARQLAIHRSAYQLKEADPHTWAIPRIAGPAKAALVKIQSDEYGNGDPSAVHAHLFADSMTALGLDPTYGAYVDLLPAATLATTNLISLLGLHRLLRGALVGHLAGFEMNSVGPLLVVAGPAGHRAPRSAVL